MASNSEQSVDKQTRRSTGGWDSTRGTSPQSGRRKVDSNDITALVGGHFCETKGPYPTQLDPSDIEGPPRLSHLPSGSGSTSWPPSPSPGDGFAQTQPSPAPRTGPIMDYLNAAPFLPSSDFPEIYRRRYARYSRSGRTHSSGM